MTPIKNLVVRRVIFSALSLWVMGGFALLFFQSSFAQFTPPCDTPPNCQPDAGSVSSDLKDILDNGADASDFTGNVAIGGTAGPIRLGIGTKTPGYPLDVISQKRDNIPPGEEDTAEARLGYNDDSKVWTGLRLDRREEGVFNEKWFAGMDDQTDDFVIRRNGTTADVTIDSEGSMRGACIGSMLEKLSEDSYDGSLTGQNQDGYSGANAMCGAGYHVCTSAEMLKTVQCKLDVLSTLPVEDTEVGFWINNGPPGFLDLQASANDCQGWTANDGDSYGPTWSYFYDQNTPVKGGSGSLDFCSNSHKFACCK